MNGSSRLEEIKKEIQAQRQYRPCTPEEAQQQEDIRWALRDDKVRAEYRGQIVVPYKRQIIAHGKDFAEVQQQLDQLMPGVDLPLVSIVEPLMAVPPSLY
jgi:hypothetical protein